MGVSLAIGVTFQKRRHVRGMSQEEKVSELHERGAILAGGIADGLGHVAWAPPADPGPSPN